MERTYHPTTVTFEKAESRQKGGVYNIYRRLENGTEVRDDDSFIGIIDIDWTGETSFSTATNLAGETEIFEGYMGKNAAARWLVTGQRQAWSPPEKKRDLAPKREIKAKKGAKAAKAAKAKA